MRFPDPPSLTPEERELAQRLAQDGPPREPSPALDARILAAARAAAVSIPTRPPPRRWPVALGLAASLVLAVGVAWQLRPLPETPARHPWESASASQTRSMPSAPVQALPEARPPASVDADMTGAALATSAQGPESLSQKPVRDETRQVSREPPAETAIVFDLPAQSTAARIAGRTAAPAPPVVAESPQAFGSTASAKRATASSSPPPVGAADDMRAQPATNEAIRAEMAGAAADSAFSPTDEPADDVPPATADSPAVREAWMQRIRRLMDSGDVAGARASLHEFVRRYPAYALPEDLHALER